MQREAWLRARNVLGGLVATLVIIVIVWIDVQTGVWNELVILAGLAAGLVTFLLTVLVLDKILARQTARRWAPVHRLAVSEFLHTIADEERSEISRGVIVPRSFALVPTEVSGEQQEEALHALREQVLAERATLTEVLSRWAQFLASSGNSEAIMRHIAEVAWQLDQVRDFALEVEHEALDVGVSELNFHIDVCNAAIQTLTDELHRSLDADARVRRSTAV